MNPSRPEIPVVALVEGSEPDIVLDAVRSLSDDCLYWCELDKESVQDSVFYALERKDMLQHLRSSYRGETNKDYQQVLDKVRDAIFVVSRLDGALLYSNSRAKEWFGVNIGEALEDVLEYGLLESEEVEMEISTRYPSVPRLTLRSEPIEWGVKRYVSHFHARHFQAKASGRRVFDFPAQVRANPKRIRLLDLEFYFEGIVSLKFHIRVLGVLGID